LGVTVPTCHHRTLRITRQGKLILTK